MAKRTTEEEKIPEYLRSILADLEENNHFLGYAEDEWQIQTARHHTLATAASLQLLAESLTEAVKEEAEVATELEDDDTDWLENEEELDDLDGSSLEEDDAEEEDDEDEDDDY